jgi:hypothetical protein
MRKISASLIFVILAGCTAGGVVPTMPAVTDVPALQSRATQAASISGSPAVPVYVVHNIKPAFVRGAKVLVGVYSDFRTSVSKRVDILNDQTAEQVAASHDGRLFVREDNGAASSAVAVYAPWGGKLLYTISLPDAAVNMAVDAAGKLYVQYETSGTNSAVAIFNPDSTTPLRTIQLGEEAVLNVSPSGDIYAAYRNSSSAMVEVYTPKHLQPSYAFTVPGSNPYNWAFQFDASGNFYAADATPAILEYAPGSTSPTGTLTTGGPGAEYLTFDLHGNLYASATDGTVQYFPVGQTVPSYAIPSYNGMTVTGVAADPFGGVLVSYWSDATTPVVLYSARSTTAVPLDGRLYWFSQTAVGGTVRQVD